MKDLHTVLRQKEQDLERVRKEIQSLLTVIPLLAADQPSSDIMHHQLLESCRTMVPGNDMAQLETYYPFIRNLRAQGRLG